MDSPEEQKLREAAARLEKQLAAQTIELQGKNRELEIEAALEKVRARTMAMRSSSELSETSVVLYQQLKELKINAIRTSVGIFDDANGAVEFWTTFSDKLEEIKVLDYVNLHIHPVLENTIPARKKNKPYALTTLTGEEVKKYYQTMSTYLSPEKQLTYNTKEFFYSFFFPAGMLNVIAYQALSEEECQIMERFAGVFGMIYTRFSDLQKAEAQTREAKIESALERVRTVAMAMRTSNELLNVCESVFKELRMLGFSNLDMRNVQIVINNDEKGIYYGYQYSDSMGAEFSEVPYDVHPVIRHLTDKLRQSKDAFADIEISGTELEDWKGFVNSFPQKRDEKLNAATELHYYFYSVGIGALGVSSFEPLLGEQLNILKRLRNVFDLCYQRYADITLAEAQTREAKIEAALEKVRSRSLAMHKAEELKEVASVLRSEMGLLGVEELETSSIYILDDKGVNAECWYAIKDVRTSNGKLLADHMTLNLKETKVGRSMLSFYHSGKQQTSIVMKGENRKEWINYCATKSTLLQGYYGGEIPERTYHLLKFSNGYVGAASPGAISTESWNLLQRVTAVFSFAYTRFLDLKKAEAQAREATIETALEKVRSRSLAMHKSDELKEVMVVVFEKLKELELTFDVVGIQLFTEGSKDIIQWVAAPHMLAAPALVRFPYSEIDFKESEIIRDVWTAKDKGKSFHNNNYSFEEKNKFFKYAGRNNDLTSMPAEVRKFQLQAPGYTQSLVAEEHSALWVDSYQGQTISDDEFNVLRRFARVFEQAYVRFLDLQKAEAQAREVQIQLALERVRAGTMTMQKSEELAEVATLLFQQFKNLGLLPDLARVFFSLIDEKSVSSEIWTTKEDGILRPGSHRVSLNANKHLQDVFEFWKAKKPLYIVELKGKELIGHLNYLSTVPNAAEDKILQQMIASPPDKLVFTEAFFNQGSLGIISADLPIPESQNTLTRFSIAFEQTYTRFLDLQKAEAQAREAKIEAALEKVRSRSLAMHKSDELNEVVAVVYEKLEELNFSIDGAAFIITFTEGSKEAMGWLADNHNQHYTTCFRMPYYDSPTINDFWKAKESGLDYFSKTYSLEEKNKWFDYAFEHTDLKNLTNDLKSWILQQEFLTQSFAATRHSILGLHFHKQRTLTESEIDILKRFSKVFEQSYTRFLDLQKAEAQTREAQIQLSLERVRARAMAMHKSDELFDLLTVLIDQFDVLGICPPYAHLSIIDQASNSFTFRISGNVGNRVLAEQVLDIDASPVWKQAFDTWKKGEYHSINAHHFPKEMMPQTWEMLKDSISMIPEEFRSKIEDFSDGLYITEASCKFGFLGYGHTRQSTPEEKDIIIRFTKEFERSYQRFLDLQKAEAQAREGQIQLALERIRSRSMAMQRSDELREVIQLIHQQLIQLNFTITNSGFGMDYIETDDFNLWMADAFTDFPARVHIPYVDHPQMNMFKEAKAKGLDFLTNTLTFDEKNQWFKYLFENVVKVTDETREFVYNCKGLATSAALMKNVFLYLLNYDGTPYSDSDNTILKRFGKVFEQTYTRFLDLQKAEAQAREAQIEAALEKVRSRSLAMHKSDELKEVVILVFEKLRELNVTMDSACIMTYNEQDKGHTSWAANPDLFSVSSVYVPYFEHPLHKSIYKAREKREGFIDETWSLDEKNSFWKWAFEQTNYKLISDNIKQAVFDFKGCGFTGQVLKNSATFLVSYSEKNYLEHEKEIIKRFANVFEQAYIRFLDLQKAEAQAREAQIEAALERVRTQTMIMRKPAELIDICKVLFNELVNLGFEEMRNTQVIIYDDEKELLVNYDYSDYGATGITTVPYGDQLINADRNSLKVDESFKVTEWSGKALEEFRKERLRVGYMADYKLDQASSVFYYFYSIGPGALGVSTFAAVKSAQQEILNRFRNVFGLAYRRYADIAQAEAQAREAQIEAALERVRSRSMGMQKSEELKEVIQIVYAQFVHLNINIEHAGFVVDYKPKGDWHFWIADKQEIPSKITHPYFESVWANQFNKSKESGVDFFVTHLNFEEKNKFYRELLSYVPDLPEESKQFYFSCPALAASTVLLENVSLYIETFSGTPYSDEENAILIRFGKVFEQTYTRFLDLQNAEAQAREAQIQLALERVRARSLAMHHTNELQEIVHVVAQQLQQIGVNSNGGVFITINNEVEHDLQLWASSGMADYVEKVTVPVIDRPIFTELREAIKKGNTFFDKVYSKEEKDEMFQHLFHFSPWIELSTERKEELLLREGGLTRTAAISKNTSIVITNHNGQRFSPKEIDILKRFEYVFEQAYTRFLDLQKAEAQARESQIQLALERVRARTMAMQRSDELLEAASLLFKQIADLGTRQWSSGFDIWNANEVSAIAWMTNPDGSIGVPFTVPYTEDPFFQQIYEAKQRGEDFFVMESSGKELEETYQYLFNLPEAKKHFDGIERLGFQMPKFQITHCAFFSQGYLMFITFEPAPEMWDIFKRFGKVFEQTYTRFLDLQKAEAQAREAKIETALERVRSGSLGMHVSQDLHAVVTELFGQLEHLGIVANSAQIHEMSNDKTTLHLWVAANGQVYPDQALLPIIENKFFIRFDEAVKNGSDFFTDRLSKEQKDEFFHHFFKHRNVPKERQDFILSQEELNRSCVLFKNTALTVLRYDSIPYTPAENEVIKRFGYVFEQSYTRFLDLQKAEAQTREATIEAALEKVRGKAMAMHNSDDLATTIRIFYIELVKLSSASVIRVGAGLLNKENFIADLTSVSKSAEGDLVDVQGKLDMTASSMFKNIYDNWLIQKECHYVLRSNQIKEYYQVIRGQVDIPDFLKNEVQYFYFPMFTEGSFYVVSETELSDGELQVFRRFISVLSLTYKRYKELRDAEAREREAIRQASLDRVRAEIASMRSTNDLERITPLIWRELTTLGIPFVRCGVFIMDDEQQQLHTFLSTPDGKAIAAFHLPYGTSNLAEVEAYWRERKMYIAHWGNTVFSTLADVLVKQGNIATREQYLNTLPKDGIHVHYLPFMQGMLYVGNPSALNQDDLHLVQSVADAFSTAYARYEDFNKLEVAKQQVDKTLTDLKQAQKQLIQSEKMASLGELTAGIAHEIQNPLNFVNNFSEVSNELLDEMQTEIEKGNMNDAKAIALDVKQNLEKILHHGKRADGIVKGMLQHSRTSSGQKELTDINVLADEYLRLAYHGLRAKDKSFNAKFETDFDESIGSVNVVSQDIGRVILNLITNAFYAVTEKKKMQGPDYEPKVTVVTKKVDDRVLVSVKDNGNGIPQKVVDKIFQPFFTTKPTGQGTGLGLSLSYDIVKAHGGEIKVETKEEEGSTFIIHIPV